MKKNFMAIASLLIAAMLLVVSCAPEANVEGKVEDGLVEAVIGLGRSAKDITIDSDNDTTPITYEYRMTAAWSSSNTAGAPIYGEVKTFQPIPTDSNGKVNGTYTISDTVSSVSLGKVTPGLWNIEVKGYTTENGVKSKLVLEGKASAYFNSSSSMATVFVAPVSSTEDVSVTITLYMQNLGSDDYNKIDYSFTNLNGTTVNSESPMMPSTDPTVTHPEGVKVYKATVDVKSGFNTVTFSLPGYEEIKDGTKVSKGGITKTFLAIPGVPVTITGSVTPAEFKEGKADIKVLSIDGGSIAIKAGETPVNSIPADGANIYALTKGTSYTFTYSHSASDTNNVTFNSAIDGADAETLIRTYTWRVGAMDINNTNEVKSVYTHDFNDYLPGYYNITCIETVSFKIDGQDYALQTSATLANVRIL